MEGGGERKVILVFMPQLGLDRGFSARPRLDFDAGEPHIRKD